jgi:hypothetical protein
MKNTYDIVQMNNELHQLGHISLYIVFAITPPMAHIPKVMHVFQDIIEAVQCKASMDVFDSAHTRLNIGSPHG